jgi:hypothetical protein
MSMGEYAMWAMRTRRDRIIEDEVQDIAEDDSDVDAGGGNSQMSYYDDRWEIVDAGLGTLNPQSMTYIGDNVWYWSGADAATMDDFRISKFRDLMLLTFNITDITFMVTNNTGDTEVTEARDDTARYANVSRASYTYYLQEVDSESHTIVPRSRQLKMTHVVTTMDQIGENRGLGMRIVQDLYLTMFR